MAKAKRSGGTLPKGGQTKRKPIRRRTPKEQTKKHAATLVVTPEVTARAIRLAMRPKHSRIIRLDGNSVLREESDNYPESPIGTLAVCHYILGGAKWVFYPVDTKEEADARIKALMASEGVYRYLLKEGPHAGGRSPVIWVVKKNGDGWNDWGITKQTEGAREYVADDLDDD